MTFKRRSKSVGLTSVVFALALLLVVVHLLQVFAVFAARWGQVSNSPAMRTQTARLAAMVEPWSAENQLQLAWLLRQEDDISAAMAAATAALRDQPAEPYVWLSAEQVALGGGWSTPRIVIAIQRVNALAPGLPLLQLQQAELALRYWPFGGGAARQAWMYSLRHSLRWQRQKFLEALGMSPHAGVICAEHGEELGLADWCHQRFRQ